MNTRSTLGRDGISLMKSIDSTNRFVSNTPTDSVLIPLARMIRESVNYSILRRRTKSKNHGNRKRVEKEVVLQVIELLMSKLYSPDHPTCARRSEGKILSLGQRIDELPLGARSGNHRSL